MKEGVTNTGTMNVGAFAQGPGATATSTGGVNVVAPTGGTLAEQLERLYEKLNQLDATAPEQKAAVDVVGRAAKAAAVDPNNSEPSTDALRNLKSAGSWVLGIAEQIGVPLALAAIKAAIGLGV